MLFQDWGTNPDWLEEGSECSSSGGEGNNDGSRQGGPNSPNVIWIPKPKHKWFVVKEIAKRFVYVHWYYYIKYFRNVSMKVNFNFFFLGR